jgi:hypothetical protein
MEEMIRGKHGRLVMFLSDFLLLSACCLFVISMGKPFLKNSSEYVCTAIIDVPESPYCKPLPSYYWSFQAFHSINNKITQFNSYWFSNLDEIPMSETQAPTLLIAIIMAQILTVASGLLSLGLRKRWIRLVPFVSSATVMSLMFFTHNELAKYAIINYEIGYWLVYPSMLLFLLAFMMNSLAGKRRTTDGKEFRQLDTTKTNTLFLCP